MAQTRLTINSLSGGVGRQVPTKRLRTEAENLDNCLVTLEKSVEKRPPLVAIDANNTPYLDVPNLVPSTTYANGGAATNFNTDNLYFHFLDIDGFNRYCIIINRAGYTFNPETANSFSYGGQDIKLDNFITVYRIEPTEWVKEEVDNTFGTSGNTSGFNRGVYEYLTYGNKSVSSTYRVANESVISVSSSSARETFGSIDFDVGIILWNKKIKLDYLPDNSETEIESNPALWGSSFSTLERIHSGDTINYKRTLPPQSPSPLTENDITNINGYWTNVRDDIILEIDPDTLEEEELGQNLENFGEIPQYPATEVQADVSDANGYRAWRTLYDYYDVPRLIPIPGGTIDWTKDHYQQTSPLTPLDRDGNASSAYKGLGKIYFARSSYLTFPVGFYRATRYKTNPYFERLRAESPGSVMDHRRFPLIIYKDTATDGKWRVRHMPLFPRRSGTNISNPGPKALERKESIQSMSIWKNRLWIATDNTLFASVAGNYFNFWINDVTNVVETDPIDIQASVGAYNRLTHVIPFQSILFALSSGSTQFEVRGGSIDTGISPFNVELRPTSFFTTSKLNKPQKMGNNVFFVNNSKLYMYLSGSAFSDEFSTSIDISNHCRDYLPLNVSVFEASSSINSLMFVDADNEEDLYFFTFRTNGDKIIQNAFYRWVLSSEDNIKAVQAYESDLYIVSKRIGNGTTNEQKLAVYFASLVSVPATTPMMDWLYKVPTGSMQYVATNTLIDLPYYDPDVKYVVLASEWGNDAYTTFELASGNISIFNGYTRITIPGNYTANPVWVGRDYEMNIELSQQVQRSTGSDGAENVIEGVLNLKKLTVRHANSGSYDIEVQRRGRPSTVTTFFPLDLNSLLTVTGQLKVEIVGEHLVKLLSYSEACKIFIKSSYPTPCNISNIEILGNFRSRNTSIE
jgi:hypothetical protein